ncbi:hypothetical protein IV53_GL000768 [Ligilactobacillus ceti DSM 22408]|uniref:Uncharacterized protein n=2 Tax=Ligilactobacillus TaxID=2767887 RepID=A0A0R2KHH9_9LACO|nr:hypothetical protein IV53_GL000768 [Ligilactobacillus ceti DSM 22408]
MLNETSQTERDSSNQIEKTVIKALDTKDRNLIKSLFSKRALKYAADIDEGIDYMFQIYEGQFKKKYLITMPRIWSWMPVRKA